MNSSLQGKQVIFIAPETFGYEKEILSAIGSMGAVVTFHGQLPTAHPLIKAIFRLVPQLAWNYANQYFYSWLDKYGPETCDILFVIKGEGLSPNFLKCLAKRYPDSRRILHLWDSFSNCKYIELKLPYFQNCSSFDPEDCKRHIDFTYRPLFFLNKYLNRNPQNLSDGIFFIGTLNGDRASVISRLNSSLSSNVTFKFWLFVRSRLELIVRRAFDPSLRMIDPSHFIYQSMPAETIASYYNASAAVLDIEHPHQTGLTMRTFEVLASGKKLITTNKSIIEHDFYDPDRICVIDRNNPIIPDNFLSAAMKPLPECFISKYSLNGWLQDILLPYDIESE